MIDIDRLIEADIERVEEEKRKHEEGKRERERLDEEFNRSEARNRLMHFFGGAAIDLGVLACIQEGEYEATVAGYKFRITHSHTPMGTWSVSILSSFAEWEPVQRIADLKKLRDQGTID